MRRPRSWSLLVALAGAVFGASACGGPSQPDGPRVTVHVLNGGRAVARMRVIVTPTSAAEGITALTRDDGSVTVTLPGAGDYVVRVVPRDGYAPGPEPMARTVTLDAAETVTLRFTVVQQGRPTEPYFEPNYGS